MPDIELWGAVYRDVPAVELPVEGGGTALFSAGSTNLVFGAIRPDAELIQTYTYDKLIHEDEEITIPAYTTTSTTLKASAALSPTITLDYGSYNYYLAERFLAYPIYSITSKAKGRLEYNISSTLYEVGEIPENTFVTIDGSQKVYTSRSLTAGVSQTFSRLFYWSSGSAVTVYSSSAYGTFFTATAPAISSGVMTVNSPALGIRGSTTYFTSTYMNAVTDVRYQYVINVFRAKKGNLNIDGWGSSQQAIHIVNCATSASHKLT